MAGCSTVGAPSKSSSARSIWVLRSGAFFDPLSPRLGNNDAIYPSFAIKANVERARHTIQQLIEWGAGHVRLLWQEG